MPNDDAPVAPLHAAKRSAALALAGVGAVVAAAGYVPGAEHALLMQRCGLLVLLYASIVLISSSRGNRWLQRKLRSEDGYWAASSWGGYYGIAALTIFLHAELRDLIPAVLDFEPTRGTLIAAAMAWLVGFSVDSMMNAIWASLWPLQLYTRQGLEHLLVFGAVAWGVFTVGAQVFPHHAFAKQDSAADDADGAADRD